MIRQGEYLAENCGPPVVLLIAQSERFLEDYLVHVASAVKRNRGRLVVAVPGNMTVDADIKKTQEILVFPPFSPSTVDAFQEAHRWNVLINRSLSRSFNYRSKTMFPTWVVSLLKAKREIELRLNKISEMNLAREDPPNGWQKKLEDIRQGLGLGYAAFFLLVRTFRAPVLRSLSLAKIWSFRGRKKIFELIASVPSGSVLGPLIESCQPNLVIVPTLGHELIPTEAVRASARKSAKSFLLVDNWDNLSSKSIFAALPDYVGTWGPQSSEHAQEIQRIPKNCVFDLGAPRFELHFKTKSQQLPRSSQISPYILYCGTSMYSREERILEILDDTLGHLGLTIPVVYRPHPQRFLKPGRALRNRNGLIRVDPSTPKEFWGSLKPYQFSPESTLPEKLAGSAFIVGGLTSVLLEAEILGKRYIAMAHHEWFSFSSPRKVYETYDHYRGIANLPHLTICRNLRDLPSLVGEHVERPNIAPKSAATRDSRPHFLVGSAEDSYSARLARAIEVILKESRDH